VSGIYAVFWREMVILRRRLKKTLVSYAIGPGLFLIAFGWGLGRTVTMEGVDYLTFMIPGLLSLSSMTQAWSIGMDINIARFYWMTFEEFQTAPLHHLSITLGEVLAGMVRGLLGAAIIILLALLAGVRIGLNPLLFAAVGLNTFVFAAASVVGAMVVKSHADQSSLNSFVITPMTFLCGTFFSLERLPDWAAWLVKILPLTHASLCIRSAALGRNFPFLSLLILAAYGLVFVLWAAWCVRKASI
jgi:ABC-type multidrug transport system permease subunit